MMRKAEPSASRLLQSYEYNNFQLTPSEDTLQQHEDHIQGDKYLE